MPTYLRSLNNFRLAPPPKRIPETVPPLPSPLPGQLVPLLPFPLTDLILPGETKSLHLYEPRFIKLFEFSKNICHGMISMAYLTGEDSSIVQVSSLCEIASSRTLKDLDGTPGIFLTIRCVARSRIKTVVEPVADGRGAEWMLGVVEESDDECPINLELPLLVAEGVRDSVEKLSEAIDEEAKLRPNPSDPMDIRIENAFDRERMVQEELERVESLPDGSAEVAEGEDTIEEECMGRFDKAVSDAREVAEEYGCYVINSSSPTNKEEVTTRQNVVEVVAVSWGAFCVPGVSHIERIRAMDEDEVFERLKRAQFVLREKLSMQQTKLRLAKLSSDIQRGDKVDDDFESLD